MEVGIILLVAFGALPVLVNIASAIIQWLDKRLKQANWPTMHWKWGVAPRPEIRLARGQVSNILIGRMIIMIQGFGDHFICNVSST